MNLAFKFYKYFEKDGLAVDAPYEDEWAPTEAVKIKRIHLVNKATAAFTDSTFYLKVGDHVYTVDVVPCVCLGPDIKTSPELDIPVAAKETLAFTLKNLEDASVDVMVALECWEP